MRWGEPFVSTARRKNKLMKKIPAALISVLVVQCASAQLLVEHFSYANGNLGNSGIGDTVWSGGDSPNVALTANSSAALTNASLFGVAGSGVIYNGGTFKKKAAPFASRSGNGAQVYCSFLLSAQTVGGSTKAFLYLQNGN